MNKKKNSFMLNDDSTIGTDLKSAENGKLVRESEDVENGKLVRELEDEEDSKSFWDLEYADNYNTGLESEDEDDCIFDGEPEDEDEDKDDRIFDGDPEGEDDCIFDEEPEDEGNGIFYGGPGDIVRFSHDRYPKAAIISALNAHFKHPEDSNYKSDNSRNRITLLQLENIWEVSDSFSCGKITYRNAIERMESVGMNKYETNCYMNNYSRMRRGEILLFKSDPLVIDVFLFIIKTKYGSDAHELALTSL